MNEQVTNILNQNITKTAKIQQLLLFRFNPPPGSRLGNQRKLRFRAKRLQKNA